MDTRAFYETICKLLGEIGMDVLYSRYDRGASYFADIQAVNPQTGECFRIDVSKETDNGTKTD